MLKKVRLFVNNNELSRKSAEIVEEKLKKNGFQIVDDDKYEIAIAVGGDGSFIRMVKAADFNQDVSYVGINAGHLGFLQEFGMNDVNRFILELKNDRFESEEIGVQESVVNVKGKKFEHLSLNEIAIRDENLDLVRCNVFIDDKHLENYAGDGIMICTSMGSTAHNLSYGGAIVFPDFATLQITPMAPINSKIFHPLNNSIIIPGGKIIRIDPENKLIRLTIDGQHKVYGGVDSVESTIGNKHIRCLRFRHNSFPQKINEKLLSK